MIAICGATGKIGGTAARRLRERGIAVTAVVRDVSNLDKLRSLAWFVGVACVVTLFLAGPPA